MAESLPYLSSPGSITKCLEKISAAATPEKVTGDFITTKLAIKGGTGSALVPFLKKIGFVKSDGSPSDLYIRYRNPSSAGQAVAEAIRIGYKSLYASNEYAHALGEAALKGLLVQVTGQPADSSVVAFTFRTLKNLMALADFEAASTALEVSEIPPEGRQSSRNENSEPPVTYPRSTGRMGMNLSYTINLNLPASSDIAVFNAIFKSLKENLLNSDEIE